MGPIRNRRAMAYALLYLLPAILNGYWATMYPQRAFFYLFSAAIFGGIALIWTVLAFRRPPGADE